MTPDVPVTVPSLGKGFILFGCLRKKKIETSNAAFHPYLHIYYLKAENEGNLIVLLSENSF